MTNYHIDLVNGNNSNDGLSWGSAWADFTNTSTVSPGDLVKVSKSPSPSYVCPCTCTRGSQEIVAATGIKMIDTCDTVWSTSLTETIITSKTRGSSTTFSFYKNLVGLSIGTKLIYKSLSTTLDLTYYTKISLWFGADYDVNLNLFSLALCSDATGDTVITSIPFPDLFLNVYTSNRKTFIPITLDNISNLPDNVNSVAIYLNNTSSSSIQIYLDTIFASPTNGIETSDLISINNSDTIQTGLNDCWYPIFNISETNILLGFKLDCAPSFYGTSGTYSLYRRNSYKSIINKFKVGINFINNVNGSKGNYVKIYGGYNTSSDIQDGETIFYNTYNDWDYNGSPSGSGFKITNSNYVEFDRFSFVGISEAYYFLFGSNNNYIKINNIALAVYTSSMIYGEDIYNLEIGNIVHINYASNYLFEIYNNTSEIGKYTIEHIYYIYCTYGWYVYKLKSLYINIIDYIFQSYFEFENYIVDYINVNQINHILSSPFIIYSDNNNTRIKYIGEIKEDSDFNYSSMYTHVNLNLWHCTNTNINYIGYISSYEYSPISVLYSHYCNVYYVHEAVCDNTYYVNYDTYGNTSCKIYYKDISGGLGFDDSDGSGIYFKKYNNTNNIFYIYYLKAELQTDIRKREVGNCLKLTPIYFPEYGIIDFFKISNVICKENETVVIKAWFRRTNETINAYLYIPFVEINNNITDILSSEISEVNNWEQLTVSFTPSKTEIKDVFIGIYIEIGSIYVDQLEIIQ